MKNISLILLLLLANLTVSFAQDGKECYTKEELKKIADRIVYAKECDTLLSLRDQQIVEKDSVISALTFTVNTKDSIIKRKDIISNLKETMISGKNNEISGLRTALNKEKTKKTWLKIGWATTSVVLTGVLTYFILN